MRAKEYLQCVTVLEAVGDQLALGEVVQPGQLAPAVAAGVEGGEALVAPLQLPGRPGGKASRRRRVNTPPAAAPRVGCVTDLCQSRVGYL